VSLTSFHRLVEAQHHLPSLLGTSNVGNSLLTCGAAMQYLALSQHDVERTLSLVAWIESVTH